MLSLLSLASPLTIFFFVFLGMSSTDCTIHVESENKNSFITNCCLRLPRVFPKRLTSWLNCGRAPSSNESALGARTPPPRSVEAGGRRPAAGSGPGVACRHRPGPGSEGMCDARRGDSAARGASYLVGGCRWRARTIGSYGSELLRR